MELAKPLLVHALFVLTTVSSLLKHQQLPLPLLIAPALKTRMEPIPSLYAPLVVQHIMHLVDPHSLLDAHALPP
jgi:hypothetical protein